MCSTGTFPPQLSPEEEHLCLDALAQGCKEARDTVIERNLRLVPYTARKFTNHAKDSEDLISIGIIGLIKAADRFDPKKKVKFSTYASTCIENAIHPQRLFRDKSRR